MTQFEKLDLLLRECGGTIQTFQVLNNGISKSAFYAYVKERGLEQASHGVYVSPDKLNFDDSSDNLCEENHTCQVAPSAHRIYR